MRTDFHFWVNNPLNWTLLCSCSSEERKLWCFTFMDYSNYRRTDITHTCKSWRALTLSVESSRREQNHDRAGLRSWATTNEMLRCSINRVTPHRPRSHPAESKPYAAKTASRNCNKSAQGKMMKHANIWWHAQINLLWIKITWGR